MEYFIQQLINGVTLGSIYGLIAIGYTMVYGIIGMINFAHGDIFMISAFIALIGLLVLFGTGITWLPLVLIVVLILSMFLTAAWGWVVERIAYRPLRGSFRLALIGLLLLFGAGITLLPLVLFVVLILSMFLTAAWGWVVERIAYRPLRGSFRLAPLISAIGMSLFLQNFVQIAQGARIKPLPPVVSGGFVLMDSGDFTVNLSYLQIVIVVLTLSLMTGFSLLISKTALGRQQRACEQDRTMAALVGINVDRTISLTFVIGAALASVAGLMFLLYYGVIDFFIGFLAGIKAFTAAVLGGIGSLPGAMLGGLLIGLIETFWSAYFTIEYKDVAAFSILVLVLIFRPTGLLGQPEVEKV